MTIKRSKSTAAFTIIEVMAAILILSIAVIGASGYRYYAALDARKAAMQATAARIGLLLCESWRGVEGTETYDPAVYFGSELAIAENPIFEFSSGHAITGPIVTESFTPLGIYSVVANNATYYAVLSWKDVSTELRALNVIIAWELRGQGVTGDTDVSGLKLFELTTYTSN